MSGKALVVPRSSQVPQVSAMARKRGIQPDSAQRDKMPAGDVAASPVFASSAVCRTNPSFHFRSRISIFCPETRQVQRRGWQERSARGENAPEWGGKNGAGRGQDGDEGSLGGHRA